MSAFDILVALVSDQATPNLTPVLDPTFRPETLVLVVSPDKGSRARWLAEALRDTGIKIEEWPIDDAWNVEHIRNRLLDLLVQRENQALTLNVTGGTKPMAIAAYEVFRAQNLPIFYVHPETDHLIWMYHPDHPPPRDLADRVKLNRFLIAHGAQIRATGSPLGVPEPLRALTNEIIQAIDSYQKALSTLNWAAQTAENHLTSESIETHLWRDERFQALLDLFHQAGYLTFKGQRLVFPDEESRFYANGGWLETHVWGISLNLKKELGLQDLCRGVQVERRTCSGIVRNELDIALLANNRFYIIECKTARMSSRPGTEEKGSNSLYKLDSLTDLLGGLMAKGMLVSYRNLTPADQQRAHDLSIQVCVGTQLKTLHEHLRQWLTGR